MASKLRLRQFLLLLKSQERLRNSVFGTEMQLCPFIKQLSASVDSERKLS